MPRNNQLGLASPRWAGSGVGQVVMVSPRSPPGVGSPGNMGTFSNYTAGQVRTGEHKEPTSQLVSRQANCTSPRPPPPSLPCPSSPEWTPTLASGPGKVAEQAVADTICKRFFFLEDPGSLQYSRSMSVTPSAAGLDYLGSGSYSYNHSAPFLQASSSRDQMSSCPLPVNENEKKL